jgi:phenylacetic acid degradation operon negative regulatory protein
MSRRHAAGAVGARGLLFTLLGEFVLPAGGSAWTAAFIGAFDRLGVEEKAARQALMRTAADGWLTSRRVGRRTLWALSPEGERLLTEGAERIYGFQGAQVGWDGQWMLVLARAPETDRAARHLLRTRLSWAGFGSPAPGVWITTHPDRAAEAERILAEAGVLEEAQVFQARHRLGELSGMVRQAWDLDAIERGYEDFIAEFGGHEPADRLARLTRLVHAWRGFPSLDPALPVELLPAHWSGARAADLFRTRHVEWVATGRAEWRRLQEAAA